MEKEKNVFIIKLTRCIDVFVKSNEEYQFFFDSKTGAFLLFDLRSEESQLDSLKKFVNENKDTLFVVPAMTEYEKRKIIETFLHDKVSSLEVSEKILKELDTLGYEQRFIEVLNEHHLEYDKWVSFFIEKMRIFIISWLNRVINKTNGSFKYAFEEDLVFYFSKEEIVAYKEIGSSALNKETKKIKNKIDHFSKIYFEEEIVNPKPKRGRPPKGSKDGEQEVVSIPDMYISYNSSIRSFVYYDGDINDIESKALDLPQEVFAKSPERALEQTLSQIKYMA